MAGPFFQTPPIGAGTQQGTGRSSGPGSSTGSLFPSSGGGKITGPTTVSREVVNLEQVIAALSALGPRVMVAAEHAAMTEAQYEFRLTQHRVPYYTGELSRSGRVEEPDYNDEQLTVAIAYGGAAGVARNTKDVDYAMIVHEDLEAFHYFGRTAKYIEDPVREELESGRAAERMGTQIRHEMGIG